MMEYRGCKDLGKVDTLDSKNIDVQQFFINYISERKPVHFAGHLTDKGWNVSKSNWSHAYLKERCPADMTVKVEYRDSDADQFGMGQEKRMTFHAFLDEIEKGSDSLYLTTQDLDVDSEGRPSILSAPLTALTQDFPLIPTLFSTLIPANLNLWYGQSKAYTTSGLHHDFHDNLYVLLRGEKRITFYSPAYAYHMYTHGAIAHIHPNGRINYQGQRTRADGADVNADKALDAVKKLRQAMLRLEEIEGRGTDGKKVEEANEKKISARKAAKEADSSEDGGGVDDVEDEIDQALEDMLDAEFDGDGAGDRDGDYEDSEGEWETEDESNASDILEVEDCSNIDVEKFLLGKRKHPIASTDACKASKVDKPFHTMPDNFSRITNSLPPSQLQSNFSLFLEALPHKVTVDLKEGEMLYIPAGWFHEVQSKGRHMAFNYWFHPPDNYMASGQMSYEQPYASSFWKEDFEDRQLA
ncbi:hypothetical protein EON65_34710 [archaeon]|nr:MAG: hypothetical protein EON65_34710 [archaeon]